MEERENSMLSINSVLKPIIFGKGCLGGTDIEVSEFAFYNQELFWKVIVCPNEFLADAHQLKSE